MASTESYFLGMDMDTAYSLRDNKKYFKLLNGELLIDDEMGAGTISNINGNEFKFTLPTTIVDPTTKSIGNSSNHRILAATSVGDYIIMLSAEVIPDEANGYIGPIGAVWKIKFDANEQIEGIINYSTKELIAATHIVYYDNMNFAYNSKIKVAANIESDSIVKIYIADSQNRLRHMNVLETGLINQPLDYLEIIQNVLFRQPYCDVVNGGSFNVGSVQYAFQFFSYSGSETKFSSASDLVNISKEDYFQSDSRNFVGSEYIENEDNTSGKSVRVRIENLERDFTYIRIVRLYYQNEYSSPEIRIVAEEPIGDQDEIIIIDNGDITLGSYTTQEYAAMGGILFSALDLAIANNRLVAANITESYYTTTYDARTYRFDDTGIAKVVSSTDATNYYLITFAGAWTYYVGGVSTGVTGTNWSIPEEFDCVNPDPATYKYKNNTAGGTAPGRIGGTGKNISYNFTLNQLFIDNSPFTVQHNGTTDKDYTNDRALELPEMRNHFTRLLNQTWSTTIDTSYQDSNGYANYANDIISGQLVGYRREETYRFGIVFFDNKGRSSFVRWIGDITMPEQRDNDSVVSYVDASLGSNVNRYDFALTTANIFPGSYSSINTYANILGLEFSIANAPTDSVSYQIVRVQLRDFDKTVIASGYITPVQTPDIDTSILRPTASMSLRKSYSWELAQQQYALTSSGANRFGQYESGVFLRTIVYADKLCNFWSPEISFYKNIKISGAKLYIRGFFSVMHNGEFIENVGGTNPTPYSLYAKASRLTPFLNDLNTTIEDFAVITNETGDYAVSGITTDEALAGTASKVYNYHHFHQQHWIDALSVVVNAQAGTGAVLKLATGMSVKLGGLIGTTLAGIVGTVQESRNEILYGTLKLSNVTQYNGNSFYSRKTNKYIKTSSLHTSDVTSITVYGGDTYISMFEHLRLYNNPNNEDGNMSDVWQVYKTTQSVVAYPVETSVNIDWRHDKTYSRSSGNRHLMKEYKGSHELDGDIFNQEYDLNLLNYSYIKANNFITFTETPTFFDKLTYNLTHRLTASDQKYDGEIADSWLKFKPNNILDVEGSGGSINAIEAISSNLYFFQDNSIGMTKIDDRALVNDSEGVSLVLGTGDTFSKPVYATNTSGTSQSNSVIKGRDAIYYFDTINKCISAVGEDGEFKLSYLKGVNSYIKSNVSRQLYKKISQYDYIGVYAGRDHNKDMIYFSFRNPAEVGNFTLGYNELLKEFVSFYSFIPTIYINNMYRFITIDPTTRNSGYMHNGGDKGEFYGATYNTVVTPIITEAPAIMKTFDSIEYSHDSVDIVGSPPVASSTFTHMRAYNNFLDTGSVTINASFRFRTWRALFPRYTENTHKKRIIGKYIKFDLLFTNSSNKSLYLNPIITHWRPTLFIT